MPPRRLSILPTTTPDVIEMMAAIAASDDVIGLYLRGTSSRAGAPALSADERIRASRYCHYLDRYEAEVVLDEPVVPAGVAIRRQRSSSRWFLGIRAESREGQPVVKKTR